MRKTPVLLALAPLLTLPAALLPAPVSAAAGSPTAVTTVAQVRAGVLTPAKARPRPTSANLAGTSCPVFPASSYWHADVRRLKVDSRSEQWLRNMSAGSRNLHPDFGPGGGGSPYGIPITVVTGAPKVPVTFRYAGESDRVRYPLSAITRIEGGPHADGDRHAVVVEATTCTLFETYDTRLTSSGWSAGSGAVWSLRSNKLRPKRWTSADAAGLPILAGLLRYDEVKRGKVDHAIRFTTDLTDSRYVWPARHHASSRNDRSYPPMGARFRLTRSFSTAGYSRDAKVVIKALKRYGLVLADNGSPWFFQGASDARWSAGFVQQLKRIPASAFQAVDTAPLRIKASSGAAR